MNALKRRASTGWLGRNWRLIRRRRHFTVSALIFIALAVVLFLLGLRPALSLLLSFDIAVLAFLGTTIVMFLRSDAQSIRERAHKEDEDYWGFLLSSAAIATVVLVALAGELRANSHADGVDIALAVCSLLLSWLFMNTIFALHYAHEFYRDTGSEHPGLDFPGDSYPDYWDFVYFAFVVGMTFQVSDVQ